MYRYETHLHTAPVSRCASATVDETINTYKELGYDGIFITNHFPDGNIKNESLNAYAEKLEYYFSDYEEGVELGKKVGLKVFLGIETTYGGTDFLVYGLDKNWFLNNPNIIDMDKRTQLKFFRQNGGFVVQAHPFRDSSYIDHIRLYPDCVDGIEVLNTSRSDIENKMARLYAETYGFIMIAGSDNHNAKERTKLAGMEFNYQLKDENDYIESLKEGMGEIFTLVRKI